MRPSSKKNKDALAVKTGGIRFQRSKGQHILKNPLLIQSIVEKAGVKSIDTVLEVGSGTGNLTMKLLERARKVCAFELDPAMVAELQKRVQNTPYRRKLEITVGDVIKAKNWPKFDLCVANLPYQISSPFIGRLITVEHHFRAAVVMLQKEFADRLLAQAGSKIYCRLSANAQFHFKIAQLIKVSRNSFKPPPRVDSSVIRIEPRHPKPPVSFAEWDGLLRLVFHRKNKTIASNLKSDAITASLRKNYLCLLQKQNEDSGESSSPDPPEIAEEGSTGLEAMHTKVRQILQKSGFQSSRARSMDEDDLLRLLLAFRKAGVPFA
ncbi:dimethyladenosine transferase [Echinococcus multilocularis]|uniref:rRNA adenine N(6)-methyltransferase n=1 Tax=Echinococcus multilocularis TaxID=6211 RepID=A0A068Y412_ECHMU|nr:dimethyladenosine transferase [Echinococcus multilocularis]